MKNLIISISDFLDYVFNYKKYKEEFDYSQKREKDLKDRVKELERINKDLKDRVKELEHINKEYREWLDDEIERKIQFLDLAYKQCEEIRKLKISNAMLKKNKEKK